LTTIYGQPAGRVPGYAYSSAMRAANLVWDAATLDRFLVAPTKVVPGTRMAVAVPKAADREALIAYLKQARTQ
jgi:cytochrome c2